MIDESKRSQIDHYNRLRDLDDPHEFQLCPQRPFPFDFDIPAMSIEDCAQLVLQWGKDNDRVSRKPVKKP
ncbi:MAG: hypothetical protein NTW79_03370 [Candidatus Berkelbacteria bacterium]|nr:hypothetical protein [Candidatus Berkelbacteria bacterium]